MADGTAQETVQEAVKEIVLEELLDEMHQMVLGFLPPDLLDLSDIPAARARLTALGEGMPAPEIPESVSIEVRDVPGRNDDDPAVSVRIYRPATLASGDAPSAALYWIHGGGLIMANAEMDDPDLALWAEQLQVVIVSVDYRLAPEHPFPAPLNDCFAGLEWMAGAADELGIDTGRIVIGGASAGGGLAAALALDARDNGGPAIKAQLLVYPMLDDRNITPSSQKITDLRVWNRSANIAGWGAYLGDAAGGPEVSQYAAAARATDLSGLPEAYINVGTLDMFHDEDVAYALALHQAGVPTELHTYPGAFHGSNKFVADSETSKRWMEEQLGFLARTLS